MLWVLIRIIGFYEDLTKIIFELSSNIIKYAPYSSAVGSCQNNTQYEGDSICNEIALITPTTHGLELYTIYGMKEQGFTFRMVHKTLFLSFLLI